MKEIHKTLPLPNDPYIKRYFPESAAFFDIETTGFSHKYAFVYLIGIAVRKNNAIHICQLLAQNRSEEASVLTAFHRHLFPGCTLITFNGQGFDIPFLKNREAHFGISSGWDSYQYTDLYKLTAKLSPLFALPDKKQKSVERFLGIQREDRLNGGELISVYYAYEKQQDASSQALLLLHNFEDVLGMTKLLSLLSYRELFQQPIQIQNAAVTQDDAAQKKLALTLPMPVPVPKQCTWLKEPYCLSCQAASAEIHIEIYSGKMKHFFENYKDYYYLPKEDAAIHKSVASYVDPAYRTRATAFNCYTKYSGDFLPQSGSLFTPCFYPDKKAKRSYFAFQNDFLSDTKALKQYAAHILQEFCPNISS